VVRHCIRCGDTWAVPRALASQARVSKWQRGVSAPDHLGFRGMTTNASASMQLDMAKAKSARFDARMTTVAVMNECPGCGAVGTYVETRAPRRRRLARAHQPVDEVGDDGVDIGGRAGGG
jgi:hypothetical protein